MLDHKDFLKNCPWCGGETKLGRVDSGRSRNIRWFEKDASKAQRLFIFSGTDLGHSHIAQRCTVCNKTTLLEKER